MQAPSSQDCGQDRRKDSEPWTQWLIRKVRDFWARDEAKGGSLTLVLVSALLFFWNRHRRKQGLLQPPKNAKEAPVSLLYQSKIEKALISATGRVIYYLLAGQQPNEWRRSTLTEGMQSEVLGRLAHHETEITTLPESFWSQLSTPLILASPFVYLALVYRMLNNTMGSGSVSTSSESRTPRISFDDVAGMDHIVEEVSEVVSYLRHPEQYAPLGARAPRAVLLHGPPGTGKTLLVRAVAHHAQVDCFFACAASSFVELYVGRGAARVRQLFQQVKTQAKRRRGWRRRRPATAILFLDELDALAKTRSSFGNSNDEREQTLNQLLIEMDGFDTSDSDDVVLVVMAASNRADVLDPAVLRRFERQVYVGYPDAAGRRAILKVHARLIRLGAAVDWEPTVEATADQYSGSDLRNLVNEAALLAVRESSLSVEQRHVDQATERICRMKRQVASSQQRHVVLPSNLWRASTDDTAS